MNCKRLLMIVAFVVTLGAVSSSNAQTIGLADSLGPNFQDYSPGDTVCYEITLEAPAANAADLVNLSVYFFAPGATIPIGGVCADPTSGGFIDTIPLLEPGDVVVLDCQTYPALEYTVGEVPCDVNGFLLAYIATEYQAVGIPIDQCDEAISVNTLTAAATPECLIDGPGEVCDTATGVLHCSFFPADTYSWVVTGDAVVDGPNDLPCVSVNPTGPGGYNVQLTVCNENDGGPGCCNTCDVDVTVVPEPECGVIGPDVVCQSAEDVLYCSEFPADNFSWVVTGDGVIDGAADGPCVLVDPTGPGGFSVQLQVCNGSSQECCSRCELGVQVAQPPDCTVVGPASVCENAVEILYSSAAPADTYFWTVIGDGVIVGPANGSSVLVSPTGTGSYTVQLTVCFLDPECCDSCELEVDVVEVPDCSIQGPNPVCEDSVGNVYCSADTAETYSWGIVGDGVIDGPTDGPCVTVDAGPTGSYTLTLELCNDSDIGPCCNRCELEVTVDDCGGFCGLTQGFWGNAGGTFMGIGTADLIDDLIDGGLDPVVVGVLGVRSLTFDSNDCIIELLPAGGKPKAFNGGIGDELCDAVPNSLTKNGRLNNVLIGQLVALSLNVRLDVEDFANLGDFVLPEGYFCTIGEEEGDCPQRFMVADSLVGLTVTELLALGNDALAGLDTGDATAAEINDAIDAVNRAFDECRRGEGCPEVEICDNNCDDDFDGDTDCDDADCALDIACAPD
jgi:hypothetical protein